MLHTWLEPIMVGARRHARAAIAGAVALALLGAFLVSRLTFDADILRLLPRSVPSVQSFRGFLETFGSLESLYVVFEAPGENDGIADHAAFVDAYAAALRAAPEIQAVDSQLFEPDRDWTYLSDRVLYLLGPFGATEALTRLRAPRLDAEILHARDLLSAPTEEIKTYVQQDPVGLFAMLRTQMERQKGGLSFDPTQPGYVSRDGRSRLVIVKPRGSPFDTDFCRALYRRLADVEQSARASAGSDAAATSAVRVRTAGSYRVSLEAEELIRTDGIRNAVGSLVLLLIVVLIVFRTPWILVFGTLPLALAALLTLGINGLVRGVLSPATSGASGMLFGLGIDGVVLLYVRYLLERQAGQDPDQATRRMAGTASSVVLAQSTTVATFLALLVLDFPTLNDLGGLVGIGMLLVTPLTLVLLPALLTRVDASRLRRPPTAAWLGQLVTRRRRFILAVGVLLTIGLAVPAATIKVDTRLERLQARTPAADFEREIATRFGLPLDVLLAVNQREHLEPLIEADRRLTERLASDRSVSVSGVSLLLPAASVQAQVADVLTGAGVRVEQVRADVDASGARAGFRPGTFTPFFDRLPRLLDPAARITYDGLMQHGLGPIVSRFIAKKDGGYIAVTYLYPQGPIDLKALETAVHRADAGFELTGLTVVNRDMDNRFIPDLVKGTVIGYVAVALLLLAVMRRLSLTFLALLPPAIGFIWSVGLLALLRVNLDIFSMLGTVTFVGMGVDYGVYVLYRHRLEGQPIAEVLAQTGATVGIACLTAIIGFGTLVISAYPPLRTFGLIAILTLSCCLTAAMVFLPALVLQLRWNTSAR